MPIYTGGERLPVARHLEGTEVSRANNSLKEGFTTSRGEKRIIQGYVPRSRIKIRVRFVEHKGYPPCEAGECRSISQDRDHRIYLADYDEDILNVASLPKGKCLLPSKWFFQEEVQGAEGTMQALEPEVPVRVWVLSLTRRVA